MDVSGNKGVVFDISRFCLNDGPGIRTTVFLKGCALKCAWCHNPESQNMQPEILFSSKRCTGCGRCASVCPRGCHAFENGHVFDRASCIACGLCTKACPNDALRLAGALSTPQEVMQEVLRDKVFFEESGGGLTVSGGEPMLQPDFLEALLLLAKQEGIHTCIETSGYAPESAFERLAPYVDCFLFDNKETSPEKHRSFTGQDHRLIRKNLDYLESISASILLRIPLIPGYNDTQEHMDGIAAMANAYTSIYKIEILPYHPLGISKAEELGKAPLSKEPVVPGKAFLEDYLQKLREKVKVEVEMCL